MVVGLRARCDGGREAKNKGSHSLRGGRSHCTTRYAKADDQAREPDTRATLSQVRPNKVRPFSSICHCIMLYSYSLPNEELFAAGLTAF